MKRCFQVLCSTFLFGGALVFSSPAWTSDSSGSATVYSDASTITASSDDVGTPKLDIKPIVEVDESSQIKPSQVDVKVWFRLIDGTFVNPLRKIWKPKEQFSIYIMATDSVYVALLQVDAKGESRIVYPSAEDKDCKNVLSAGLERRIPSLSSVAFTVDEDGKDETISLVVFRTDWIGIKDEAIELRNDRRKASSRSVEIALFVAKAFNDRVLLGKKTTSGEIRERFPDLKEERADEIADAIARDAPFAEFHTIAPVVESSSDANDVCVYLTETKQVGQWTFIVKKQDDEPQKD